MGTAERRQKEKERKEREIIEAARELFFRKGYAPTTVDDIAARLEISKGSVYLHFGSKDEIYYAVAEDGLRIAGRLFEEAAGTEKSGLGRFFAMGLAYVTFWNEHPGYRRLFREGASLAPPSSSGPHGLSFAATGEGINAMMVRAIEGGIEDGSIRAGVSPDMVAFCASSSVDGILTSLEKQNRSRGKGLDQGDVLPFLFELFGRALASDQAVMDRTVARLSKASKDRAKGGH